MKTIKALALTAALCLTHGTAALAQAPGSVLCRNGMERADREIAAVDRRVDAATKRQDTAELCEVWRLSLDVRRKAQETYDRCRVETRHEDRLHEIVAGSDEVGRNITQFCG
jgi:uncharacterized membrane protein